MCQRSRNSTLLLGGPGHSSPRVQECESGDQSAVEMIISPVHISIPNKFGLPHGVHDAMARASSEVSHNVLGPIDVIWAKHGGEWGEGSDSSAYVGAGSHSGIG